MNVGIVTQPLCGNYGGILQNYALQTVLKSLGCNPITLDLQTHLNESYWDYVRRVMAFCVKKLLLGRNIKLLPYNQVRSSVFDDFVTKQIAVSEQFHRYTEELIGKYDLDCLIAGSDQVWRPRYNVFPTAMFLDFASKKDIKRIAYAASFGVDRWEFSQELTEKCKSLITMFDAVSVREATGVILSKMYFGVNAEKVLDPTLLLDASVYDDILQEVKRSDEDYIAVYALNMTEEMEGKIHEFANKKQLKIKRFTSDAGQTLSIPEWIASIRDAKFVFTDSFHGTAFSIIYNKDFYAIVNNGRGASRFDSLLSELDLSDRLLDSMKFEIPEIANPILWDNVNNKRNSLKTQSISFLYHALIG